MHPEPHDPMQLTQLRGADRQLTSDARDLRRALNDLLRVYQFRDRDRICCYDVSVTQSHALGALVERGPLTLNDLAAELFLDKSTTSRVVDGLEKKGYVSRRRNPESGRSILVDATAEGRTLSTRIERDLLEEEMRLIGDFDPEVRQAAARLIGRLAAAAAARVDTTGGSCCTV